jgi:hypothetical protein
MRCRLEPNGSSWLTRTCRAHLLPLLAAFATVLHAVNAVAEIFFMSKKSGMAIKTASFRTSKLTSTKLDLVNIAKVTNPDAVKLTHGDPSAFFDVEAERWVLSWSSYPGDDHTVQSSLYVAVSHGVDPLEYWTVYELAAKPLIAPGMRFCENTQNRFSPMAPQVCCCCLCYSTHSSCILIYLPHLFASLDSSGPMSHDKCRFSQEALRRSEMAGSLLAACPEFCLRSCRIARMQRFMNQRSQPCCCRSLSLLPTMHLHSLHVNAGA